MWLDKVILQHALVPTNSGKKNLILKKKKIGTLRKKEASNDLFTYNNNLGAKSRLL